jgi:hypothetical protein
VTFENEATDQGDFVDLADTIKSSRRIFIKGAGLAIGALAGSLYVPGLLPSTKRPGPAHVRFLQSPSGAGALTSYDASRAIGLPGVLDVMHVYEHIAVVAVSSPAVERAARLVEARWNDASFEAGYGGVANARRPSAEAVSLVDILYSPSGIEIRSSHDVSGADRDRASHILRVAPESLTFAPTQYDDLRATSMKSSQHLRTTCHLARVVGRSFISEV